MFKKFEMLTYSFFSYKDCTDNTEGGQKLHQLIPLILSNESPGIIPILTNGPLRYLQKTLQRLYIIGPFQNGPISN